jgi:hypothetical protein
VSSFVSCSSNDVENKPEILLDRATLINVIADVQLLEAHYHNLYQRPDVYANALDSACIPIYESNGITKNIFEENLKYQSKNGDTLFVIYESALDTINNRLNSLKGIN